MVTLVVVDTSEMMGQDEEVALEFRIWIGGNNGIFHCLVSYHCQQKEGRGGLQCQCCLWSCIIGMNIGVYFGGAFYWGRGLKQTHFPSTTPSPHCTG